MRITTKRSLLALAIGSLSSPMYALELLTDDVLSNVTAQDGVSLHSIASEIKMDKIYWQDDGKELQMRDVKLTNWDSITELDFGSNSGLASATPAISIRVLAKPFLLTVGGIGVCTSGSTCTSTFGEFALETKHDSVFSFFNTNGFFDGSSSNGRFRFNIDRANIYFAQSFAGKRNLGILQNFTLNGSLNGKFTIDANEGIRTQGTLSLNRDNTTHTHGLQFDIAHKADVPTGFTTAGSAPITRFGISGNILNFDWKMKADSSLSTAPIANSQGIKMSMSGVLDKNNFQMEVGGYPNPYSIVFKNWVDLADGAAVTPSSPDFTTGDIYLNNIASTGTLPNFFSGYGAGFGQLVAAGDAVGLSIRGLNFQAYPKQLVFQDNTTYAQNPQDWSLITSFYNVDANALLYSGGHPSLAPALQRGIGFDLTMALTGRDATGKEGSHFLVADPEIGSYMGFRNLDGTVRLNKGQFYIVDKVTDGINGFKVTSQDMKFDLSGEFAVGKLPNGSSVKYIGSDSSGVRIHDEMFGVRLRSEGTLNVAIAPPPEGGLGLGVSGSFTMVDPNPNWHSASMAQAVLPDPEGLRNSIVITEPVDGTEIQFADISGVFTLRPEHIKKGEFNDASTAIIGNTTDDYTDVSRVEVGNNIASFSGAIQFGNRSNTDPHDPNDVFRIGDVALGFDNDTSRLTAIPEANRYRLGEIVFTGGRLYAEITIKPQL